QLNVMEICDAARERGIKVLLSGQGADELFMGYRRHQAALLADYWRNLPSMIKAPIAAIVRAAPVAIRARGLRRIRWLKRFLGLAALDEESAYHRSYTYFDSKSLDRLTN